MRSPVGLAAVAQGDGGAGAGGDERLTEFIERTCHGPLGLPLARSGLQACITELPNPRTGPRGRRWGGDEGAPRSVADTVTRLAAVVDARKMKMFAVTDHSGEATNEGLELRDTKLVIFGSPTANPGDGGRAARGTRFAARGPRLGRRIHDEDQLHRAACARCPLEAERRSGRQTRRHGRADGRRHQSVKPLSHSTVTSQAARCRRTALAIARHRCA